MKPRSVLQFEEPIDEGMPVDMPELESEPEEEESAAPVEAPKEPSENDGKKEQAEEPPKPFKVPFRPIAVDESAVLEFGEGKFRIPLAMVDIYRGVGGGTLSEPIEVAFMRNNDNADLIENGVFQDQMDYAYPMTGFIDRTAVDGSKWSNNVIVGEDHRTSPSAVRPKGNDLMGIFSASNQLGQTTKWTFHNTGVVIHMRAALDSELINIEMQLLEDRARVGLETHGVCLTSDMGVHIGLLVDFALSLVVKTNVPHDGNIQAALRSKLRGRESIEILLAAVLTSMYPHGFPWAITCSNAGCAFREATDIFFARSQWVDKSRLTERCLTILHRNTLSLPDKEYDDYQAELPTSVGKFEFGNVTYNFALPTITDYAYATRRWLNVIEKDNTESLARIDTDAQREAYLDSQKASRAMMQYSHYVSSIDIEYGGTVSTIVDRDKIEEALIRASADLELVVNFINAVSDFELMSRMTIIGHLNRTCNHCGKHLFTEEDEVWKSIVPLPVDRIFFTLTQLKTQILRGTQSRR
ncbi:MAG: hypothetical protein ACRDDY_13895 [Clostridium sp.]|uniref:hypothetical protein n=1 Tax=Clostridium sp. TaxID=1506 RepID=UPI003EE547FA